MENIYPAYLDKITRTEKFAREKPAKFAAKLNDEYTRIRKSKAKKFKGIEKLPVRIYGSGDYIKEHYHFLKKLNFNFYIISKSLTQPSFSKELEKVHALPNCTNILLSFDTQNLSNYNYCKEYLNTDGYRFAFTGTADDFLIERDFNERHFDIFFNIGDKKVDAEASKAIKQRCPTDSKHLKHNKACAVCNKCWRSSKTKGHYSGWNSYPKQKTSAKIST